MARSSGTTTIKIFDPLDGYLHDLPDNTQVEYKLGGKGYVTVETLEEGKISIRSNRKLKISPRFSNSIEIEIDY
jgi:hypothetical protein